MLSGPWRLTEPCDVTIGGATWLDQAQETAARANQNAGPHRKKTGQQGAAPISMGVGWGGLGGRGRRGRFQMRGEKRRQTAADPHRKGTGPDNCPATAKKEKCPQRSREEEEMQGEA